jgi:hypothetical protein
MGKIIYNPRATGRHGGGMPAFRGDEGFATFLEEGIYEWRPQ